MSLDEARQFLLQIDGNRTIFVTPATDDATVVLGVEDPASVAVVELTQAELRQLIDGLQALVA